MNSSLLKKYRIAFYALREIDSDKPYRAIRTDRDIAHEAIQQCIDIEESTATDKECLSVDPSAEEVINWIAQYPEISNIKCCFNKGYNGIWSFKIGEWGCVYGTGDTPLQAVISAMASEAKDKK